MKYHIAYDHPQRQSGGDSALKRKVEDDEHAKKYLKGEVYDLPEKVEVKSTPRPTKQSYEGNESG